MTPCILMRPRLADDNELDVARKYFPVYTQRAEVPPSSLVVGRFANLPYHLEFENDLALRDCVLINSTQQHGYVADFSYYPDLKGLTFRTWFDPLNIPSAIADRPFVVKGTTNSDKRAWWRRMFAVNLQEAHRVAADLRGDAFIGPQGVVYREYVPLQVFEDSVAGGPPLTNEWRTFYYRGKRLAHGYYWANIDDWTPVHAAREDFENAGLALADKVAATVADKIPFVCIDVAKTQEGAWMVVELNDGCMAGLNGSVPADELYKNLAQMLSSGAKSHEAPARPILLRDKQWYWVRYEAFGEVYTAPARYHAETECFYSVQFSGIPVRELTVLRAA